MEEKGRLKYGKVEGRGESGEKGGKKKWYGSWVREGEVELEGLVWDMWEEGWG